MAPVFADTSFYVALNSRRDSLHSLAVECIRQLRVSVITTEFVLLELANFFRRPGDREKFVDFELSLRADAFTEIIPSASELYVKGRELFASRPDKEWSLTDCVSFQIMTHRGMTDALTADEHFEQAGFRALLRSENA
jgi:predicted nucleic acid-binding protein